MFMYVYGPGCDLVYFWLLLMIQCEMISVAEDDRYGNGSDADNDDHL